MKTEILKNKMIEAFKKALNESKNINDIMISDPDYGWICDESTIIIIKHSPYRIDEKGNEFAGDMFSLTFNDHYLDCELTVYEYNDLFSLMEQKFDENNNLYNLSRRESLIKELDIYLKK